MKIAIIGYTGAGKSSLAEKCALLFNAPVLHLDTVHFTSGWQKREVKEAYAEVDSFCNQESWIIEGNYHALNMERRYRDADQIIFMNFNRFTCFYQAVKRALHYRGIQRTDLSEGCYDRLTPSFMAWILFNGRNRQWRQYYDDIGSRYPDKFIVLHNHHECEVYLSSFKRNG